MCRHPHHRALFSVCASPKIWYMGSTIRIWSPERSCEIGSHADKVAANPELLRTAPFGRPVVPLVYISTASPSGSRRTFGALSAPASVRDVNDSQLAGPPP